MKNKPSLKYYLILIILLSVSFVQHLEHFSKDIQGIHSWRQSQTMWNIRNFVRHDSNILNPRVNSFNGGRDNVYRYEFPIMQWGIAKVLTVFGEKIEIVRAQVFIIGAFSVLGIFLLVHFLMGNWLVALITAILFQYSPVFYYYTINPLPDNLALCCSIWYMYFILIYFAEKKNKHLILASIFILIATLAKLPFLMYAMISIVYFFTQIKNQKKLTFENIKFASIQLLIVFPSFVWYSWVIPTWSGNPVLNGGIKDDFSLVEYLKIAYYHATNMFPNTLLSMPVWILFIVGVVILVKQKSKFKSIYSLIFITFVYLILELKPIGIVHDYYMFPFLPWLYVIVGIGVEYLNRLSPNAKFALLIILLWSGYYTKNYTDSMWSIEKSYFNEDVFLYSEDLKNAVPNEERCIILNDLSSYVFSYRIDKMGYIFRDDYLPIEWIEDMVVNDQVRYMYSDSEKINNSVELKKFVDEVILVRNTIKVFKLKNPYENDKSILGN